MVATLVKRTDPGPRSGHLGTLVERTFARISKPRTMYGDDHRHVPMTRPRVTEFSERSPKGVGM
ncbi:hypothetical protein OG874_21970 [Nocardia sp. NBC_00565]|uniref:hypothetical protein n=1 Tax=Nocardia sp. NBC_00565 TaxID=2975993 RepID=UPI002E822F42|nr:hypothetical protein [Nocardia sp. NBC_00565]WUC07585.1 hypothetical protein OG874_21970 [Nocardia sp. NBC_00565]